MERGWSEADRHTSALAGSHFTATLSGVGSSFGADFALWAVPEPASAGLIAAGALLLVALRVRR